MEQELIRAQIVMNAACARAIIRMHGYEAANQQAREEGEVLVYHKEDFDRIIEEEGIDVCSIVDSLKGVI